MGCCTMSKNRKPVVKINPLDLKLILDPVGTSQRSTGIRPDKEDVGEEKAFLEVPEEYEQQLEQIGGK